MDMHGGDLFVERNGQAKFKDASDVKETKTGWSRPVKEVTVIVYIWDRQELGLEIKYGGRKGTTWEEFATD